MSVGSVFSGGIPAKCNGCGKPLLLENLYVDDGCPCNTPRGVNFTPARCETCKIDICVKPGHRLVSLFGDVARWVKPEPEEPIVTNAKQALKVD